MEKQSKMTKSSTITLLFITIVLFTNKAAATSDDCKPSNSPMANYLIQTSESLKSLENLALEAAKTEEENLIHDMYSLLEEKSYLEQLSAEDTDNYYIKALLVIFNEFAQTACDYMKDAFDLQTGSDSDQCMENLKEYRSNSEIRTEASESLKAFSAIQKLFDLK